jgi:uncharacterized protein (DUF427 family)
MAKVVWNAVVPAQRDACVVLWGNRHWPAEPVQPQLLRPSDHHTVCPWKGQASYYDVLVDKRVNPNAAWYYPAPTDAARRIQGRIHFWKGVRVDG